MANPKHLKILRQGVKAWNEWRELKPRIKARPNRINLTGAHLARTDLAGVNLSDANLSGVNLVSAQLIDICINNAID